MRERPLTTFEKSSRHWITDFISMELSKNRIYIYIYIYIYAAQANGLCKPSHEAHQTSSF